MKYRLCALLLAALLLVPCACPGEDPVYFCDSCEGMHRAVPREREAEWQDGEYGVWADYYCENCGASFADILPPSWYLRTPPETPAPAPTAAPDPTPAPTPTPLPEETPAPVQIPDPTATPVPAAVTPPPAPETPVPVPPDNPPASGPSAAEEPAVVLPDPPAGAGNTGNDTPTAAQTLPPALPAETAPEARGAPGNPAPAQPAAENNLNPPSPDVLPDRADRRDTVKYPVFSKMYPSRRLHLSGDPAAQAPLPGEKVWPATGSQVLTNLLGR